MNMKRMKQLFLILVLLLVLYPSTQVQAKVHSLPSLYMEVTVPEDTIILTADTPNMDEQWKKAGITDPKTEKENFSDMSVKAILYDPSSATTVRLMQKQTSETKDLFHLSLLSEDELTAYLDTLFTSTDENTTFTMEKYPQQETPFYHLSLEATKEGVLYSEILYGTIVNGYSISYDLYAENNTEPLDESFIKELVAGTHFTKILDKAEVAQQGQETLIYLIIAIIIIIGIIIVWVLLSKKAERKNLARKKLKLEELSRFFVDQRQREEKNIKDTSIYLNRTKYTEEVIKNFYIYDRIFKHIKVWIITAIMLLLSIYTLFTSGSLLGCGIIIVVVVVFLFYKSFQIEKIIARDIKTYKKNKSTEAVFTFYEEYYTISGIQSSSKYPYVQLIEIKKYKDCMYLYYGTENAHYLKKDGFEQDLVEFEKFIKERTKTK
ncbi:MAG: YcxB family protein [Mobilitalea sp.]